MQNLELENIKQVNDLLKSKQEDEKKAEAKK
jgi:hypothetical protein